MMTRWEYRIEKNLNETKLAEIGKFGWELVAVVLSSSMLFYFKRGTPT